jgi:hypothetical protein
LSKSAVLQNRFTALLGLVLFCFLWGCTLDKRLYRPGYHTVWHVKGRELRTADLPALRQPPAVMTQTAPTCTPPTSVTTAALQASAPQAPEEACLVAVTPGPLPRVAHPPPSTNAQPGGPPRFDTQAKAAFASGTLSMVSLILLFAFNINYPVLAICMLAGVFLFGIFALVLARKFKYRFHNARGQTGGAGLANTGAILAWLSFAMLAGFLLLITGLVLIFNVILPSF